MKREQFATPGATVIAAAIVAASVVGLGWVARQSYGGPSSIIQTLRREPRNTHVLADYLVADWVLWEAPNLRGQVEFDARAELLTRSQWRDVMHFPAPIAPGRILLVTSQARVTRRLERQRQWRTLAAAGGIHLFVPRRRARGS
jgi:hypothetical protein